MTIAAPTSATVVWQRLGKVTGVAGLTTVVLFFSAVLGTRDEPLSSAGAPNSSPITGHRTPIRARSAPISSPSR